MKIIIVGDGKVGLALTEQLAKEGHELTVIDSNPQVLEQSVESFDVMVVHGNGAAMRTLQEAKADKADLVIAATSSDEINLISCIVAKKLGADHTIARIRNPEYMEQMGMMREDLGLSMTIMPEYAAAHEAFNLLQFPSFLKRDIFAKGRVEIVEMHIGAESKLAGVALTDLNKVLGVQVLVCAVKREDRVHIPDGRFVLEPEDRIYVTANALDLARLVKGMNLTKQKVRNVMIVGGSRIAFYLAQSCITSGIGVKIIEHNHQRCLELADCLPQAVIIEADGTRQDILQSEGLENTDALVTLTNIDEENLIMSMYACHIGVPKVITKINRTEYISIFRDMGIECVISPKILCSTDIVRYVRAMENATGGSVLTLHRIADGQAEALEFLADGNTQYLNKPLSEIPTRSDVLVACITHHGKPTIPNGSSSGGAGDTVIVVTTAESPVQQLNDIFTKQ